MSLHTRMEVFWSVIRVDTFRINWFREVKEALIQEDKVPEQYGIWNEENQTQFLSLQELISPLVKSLQEVHVRLKQLETKN